MLSRILSLFKKPQPPTLQSMLEGDKVDSEVFYVLSIVNSKHLKANFQILYQLENLLESHKETLIRIPCGYVRHVTPKSC